MQLHWSRQAELDIGRLIREEDEDYGIIPTEFFVQKTARVPQFLNIGRGISSLTRKGGLHG